MNEVRKCKLRALNGCVKKLCSVPSKVIVPFTCVHCFYTLAFPEPPSPAVGVALGFNAILRPANPLDLEAYFFLLTPDDASSKLLFTLVGLGV